MKIVKKTDLDTACGRRVYEKPLVSVIVVVGAGEVMDGAVVFVQDAGAEVGRSHRGTDQVRFADP